MQVTKIVLHIGTSEGRAFEGAQPRMALPFPRRSAAPLSGYEFVGSLSAKLDPLFSSLLVFVYIQQSVAKLARREPVPNPDLCVQCNLRRSRVGVVLFCVYI